MPAHDFRVTPTAMTPDPIAEYKQVIRRHMRRRRAGMSLHDQALAGLALARRLERLKILRRMGVLLGTLPNRGEVDARPFLQAWMESGGELALPRINDATSDLEIRTVNHLDQTVIGFRGIMEPDPYTTVKISPRSVPFLLVPGLAFDPRGNRLGQGGGHYDQLLAALGDQAISIGICHDFQILPRIPTISGHDFPVDFVVSPVRVIQSSQISGRLAPG